MLLAGRLARLHFGRAPEGDGKMARSHNISYHNASGKVGELVIAQIGGEATIKKRAFRNRSQSAAQMQQRATLV